MAICVEKPLEELPNNTRQWLAEQFRDHARPHFSSATEVLDWCDKRGLLAFDERRDKRSLKASTPVEVYRAIRQIVLELEYPDVWRELQVLRQSVVDLREENEHLNTTVAVLSGQLRAARDEPSKEFSEAIE